MDWRREDEAALVELDGLQVMRFMRVLPHPVEKVWAALTIPERIADWLAPAEVDLRLGGRYHVAWPGSAEGGWRHVIRALDPPRLLEIGSVERPATRFELTPDGDSCRLMMTDFLPLTLSQAGEVLAGWHLLLDGLPAAVEGRRAVRHKDGVGLAGRLQDHYRGRLDRELLRPEDGVVRRVGDLYELRFVRRLDRPIDKVWAALTIPERLADWIGEAEVEPRVGGRYVIRFRDPPDTLNGVIIAFDPPRLLEYAWPEGQRRSTVRWELEPDGAGCRLTLIQGGVAPEHVVGIVSGWHDFLEMIPAAADGIRTEYDAPRWRALEAHYKAKLAGEGLA